MVTLAPRSWLNCLSGFSLNRLNTHQAIMSQIRSSTLIALLIVFTMSCKNDDSHYIHVFAAASLTNTMEHLATQFTQENETNILFNFGGSVALAQQIRRGAPVDIYISAGQQPMNILEHQGLIIPDTRIDLFTNQLVLVANRHAPPSIEASAASYLSNADVRIAIANPDLAPAGLYAKESLKGLGLWNQIESGLIYAMDVRSALKYVEEGNADLGIVYATDARVSDELYIVAFLPESSHSLISYPAAVVKTSEHRNTAIGFLGFLQSIVARETFEDHGFIPTTE